MPSSRGILTREYDVHLMLCLRSSMFNRAHQFLKRTFLYILAVPLLFTALGIGLNQIVLSGNNDTFPVQINEYKVTTFSDKGFPVILQDGTILIDDTHSVMTSETHFNALADIFDMNDTVYSIGDFSLMLGDYLWVFAPFVYIAAVTRKLNQTQN